MRLSDLLNSLTKRGKSGASIDDLRNEFGDDHLDDVKRLVQAALDLEEIKKNGKGRGVKYYIVNIEIPQHIITTKKVSEEHLIEGVIDVSKCTTLEKIERIKNSEHKLQSVHTFSYRLKLENQGCGNELSDFINAGVIDVDVKLANVKGKNVIISTKKKHLNNKLLVFKETDGNWAITKIFFECPERPETQTFSSQAEFEKCLKTLSRK